MSSKTIKWLSLGVALVLISCLPNFIPTAHATEPTQSADCKSLAFNVNDTKYTFTATASVNNGARILGYKFDFGDHQSYSFTFDKTVSGSRNTAKIDHAYARSGIYQARAFVIASVHSKMRYVSSEDCMVSVSVGQSSPNELTSVGPGNPLLLSAGVAVASGSAHHFALRRGRRK